MKLDDAISLARRLERVLTMNGYGATPPVAIVITPPQMKVLREELCLYAEKFAPLGVTVSEFIEHDIWIHGMRFIQRAEGK